MLGALLGAGLPNITGWIAGNRLGLGSNYGAQTTGAFEAQNFGTSGWYGAGLDTGIPSMLQIKFFASRSNAIYGSSSTVDTDRIMADFYTCYA